jgi:hypothetical protein
MERLDAELRRELDRFGPGEGGTAVISRAWTQSVGETVARNAWPIRLATDGTLHVATSSSTWAFELARLAETILEQLRATLGALAPRTLKFAPGPVPEPPPALAATVPTPAPATPEQRAEAAELAAGIGDEELRELVARAAAASLARAAREPTDDRRF